MGTGAVILLTPLGCRGVTDGLSSMTVWARLGIEVPVSLPRTGDALKPTLTGRHVQPPQEDAVDTWRGVLSYHHRFGNIVANTVYPGEAGVRRLLTQEEIMRVLDIPENRTLGMTEHQIKQLTQSPIPGKIMYAALHFLTEWRDIGGRNKRKTLDEERQLGETDPVVPPSSLRNSDEGIKAEGSHFVHDPTSLHVSNGFSSREADSERSTLNKIESIESNVKEPNAKGARTTLTTILEGTEEQRDKEGLASEDTFDTKSFNAHRKEVGHGIRDRKKVEVCQPD